MVHYATDPSHPAENVSHSCHHLQISLCSLTQPQVSGILEKLCETGSVFCRQVLLAVANQTLTTGQEVCSRSDCQLPTKPQQNSPQTNPPSSCACSRRPTSARAPL